MAKIESDYRTGKMLSGELKEILIDNVTSFLERHQESKEQAKDLVDTFRYDGKLAKKAWTRIRQ